MSAFSNYYANKIIDATLRNTSFALPSTVYLGLFTSATGLDTDSLGTATEVSTSGTAYARKSITFAAPTNGVTAPAADVEFIEATGNWGTVTHVAILDAATGGHVIYWAALNSPKAITAGDVARFKTTTLSVTVS